MNIKSFVLSAVVACATALHGDVLLWQVSTPADVGGTSTDWAYAKIYSTTGSDATPGGGTLLTNIIGADQDTIVYASDFTSSAVGAYLSGDYSASSFYFELFDSGNNSLAVSSLQSYAQLQEFIKADMSMQSTLGVGGWSGGTYTATPEPTSGLMLLVGMAMLGLRRRKVA